MLAAGIDSVPPLSYFEPPRSNHGLGAALDGFAVAEVHPAEAASALDADCIRLVVHTRESRTDLRPLPARSYSTPERRLNITVTSWCCGGLSQ